MTTDEAFEKMINTRGIYHKLGLLQSTAGSLRYQFKHNKGISNDKKIKLLQQAGYKIIQELKWQAPSKK